MKPFFTFLLILLFASQNVLAQDATIREEMMEMTTYPFSDPNPVPEVGRIYPYFSFDGYTAQGEQKKWKMVILENDFIKVFVCPDIGGKVWGAIEKSTGKEFLYFNHVVKFRDVAMRGAWTSGGLEFNFGDIGHIPTCATPVDYVMKNNPDGSVSCIVGALDLPSGSKWNVEISVHPGKAFFETRVRWFNNTSLPNTYYHWMNAAAKSEGNLEFIYPGSNWIGHGGEIGEWPGLNGEGVNYYENNNFGSYKSYHVMNSYADFFGGYWHDDNFGFGHWSNYDEKPGKKLWIWGLSQQGMIWEDLLTDNDGQYIEFQAGKLFNQAAEQSTYTPFKHKEFAPHDTDVMDEMWFPLKETGGMVAVSPSGILNIEKKGNLTQVIFSALQDTKEQIIIKQSGEVLSQTDISLMPLEKKEIEFQSKSDYFKVYLGSKLLYSSDPTDNVVERPIEANKKFNWESAYGLFTMALELEKQRKYDEAFDAYRSVLKKDPGFLPALNRLALGHYRRMEYKKAFPYLQQAISIDTYDPEANYLYGLVNKKTGNLIEAKSAFSLAASSVAYRVPGYIELSKLFLAEGDYLRSIEYSRKALKFGADNPVAYQLLAVAFRKEKNFSDAERSLEILFDLDATNHLVRFEQYQKSNSEEDKKRFISSITNELPVDSYIDLGLFYDEINCREEALEVFKLAPENPIVNIWLAHLDQQNSEFYLNKVSSASPLMVFPFRNETAELLEAYLNENGSWKFKYYLALIYWNRGLESKTKQLFADCGSDPDFAPFYIAKAKLSNDDIKEDHLLKAHKIDENEWRASMALTDLYLKDGDGEKALFYSKGLLDKYPEQSLIGLNYARSLMKLGMNSEAVEFLLSYNVLPFEGATFGRDLYYEACVRVAIREFKNKNYEIAVSYAEMSLKWPENLGVGRPYDLDERLSHFIIAKSCERLDKSDKARDFYARVAAHQNASFPTENSKLIFQLLALEALDETKKSDDVKTEMIRKNPGNPYLLWALAYDNQSVEKANKIAQEILNSEKKPETKKAVYSDKEFQMVLDYFR